MYLDPGNSTMLIQVVVAAVAVAGVFLLATKTKLRTLFQKKKDGEDAPTDEKKDA